MPYRGRYQQGEEVSLGVLCVSPTGVATAPDAVPTAEVYGPTGKVLTGKAIPVRDRYAATAAVPASLFQLLLFLGPLFGAGAYQVLYRWTTGGGATSRSELDTFDVLPGGDAAGNVISLYWYARPQANFVVQQLDSGQLKKNRNPRL